MPDLTSESLLSLVEELEKRGELSPEDSAFLDQQRKRGAVKTTRDQELLSLEKKILDTNVKAIDDDGARGLVNAYGRLAQGEHDDFDGKKRWGKAMQGGEMLKRLQADLDKTRYKGQFPDKLSEFKGMNPEQQAAAGYNALQDKELTSVKASVGIDKARQRQQLTALAQTTADTGAVSTIPRKLTDKERLVMSDLGSITDEADLQMLRRIGENDAFMNSYVPVRRWLEDKVGRNPHIKELADTAVRTGKLPDAAVALLTDEERSAVQSYVRHVRPFDSNLGIWGTTKDFTRAVVGGLLTMPVKGARFFAGVGEEFSLDVLDWTGNPFGLETEDYRAAIVTEKKTEEMKDFALGWKAPERSRRGKAFVMLGETLPFMLSMAYGGGAGAFAAGSSVAFETSEALQRQGVGVDEANGSGIAAGILAVYVERLGGVAGKGPLAAAMSKQLVAKSASKYFLTRAANGAFRFGERWLTKNFPAELGEEFIEGVGNAIAQNLIIDGHDKEQVHALVEGWKQASESVDVVGLMTAFGSIRGPRASSLSDNASQLMQSEKSLSTIRNQTIDFIRKNPSMVKRSIAEVERAIVDTWANNDKAKARELLLESGISQEALTKAEPFLNKVVELEKAGEASAREEFNIKDLSEQDVATATAEAAKFGQTVEVQDEVLDERGALVEGLYEGGKVLLSRVVERPVKEVVREEIFHGLWNEGGITTEERSFIKQELASALQGSSVAEDYSDATTIVQLEELAAKRFAEYTPQQRNIMTRFFDWVKKVVPFIKDKGFKSLEQVFAAIEEREGAKEVDAKLEEAQAAPQDTTALDSARAALLEFDDGKSVLDRLDSLPFSPVRNNKHDSLINAIRENLGDAIANAADAYLEAFTKAAVEAKRAKALPAQQRQARFSKASTRALATRVALGRLATVGEKAQGITGEELAAMFPGSTLDFDELIEEAREEIASQREATGEIMKEAGQFTDAALRLEVKRAQATAVKLGRAALSAEALAASEAKKAKETLAKREKNEVRVLPSEYLNRASSSVSVGAVVQGGDFDVLADAVATASNDYSNDKKIQSQKARDSIYKHTLYHVLWDQAVKHLKFDRSRSAARTAMDKIKQESTKVSTANEVAQEVIARLQQIQEVSESKDLQSEFSAILKTKGNKRVATKTLLKDRLITPKKAAELAIINNVWQKSEEAVEDLAQDIDTAINYVQGDSDVTVEEFQETAVRRLAKVMPAINDATFLRLTDAQKLQVLRDLVTRFGSLKHKGNEAVAEAVNQLTDEINGAVKSMAEIARDQSAEIIKNVRRLSLATKSRKRGVVSAFSGGAIFGSVQNRLRDFTRLASDNGKAAMEKVLNALNFQAASRDFDAMKIRMANEFQAAAADAYGSVKADGSVKAVNAATLQAILIKMTTPQKKFAKYSPSGEAISLGQVMQLVATWQQEDYRSNMTNTWAGFNQATIDNMVKDLSAKDRLFMDKLRDLYSKWGVELDAKSMELFGTPMANLTEWYMPVAMANAKPYNAQETRLVPLTPPAYNVRVRSNAKVDLSANIVQMIDGKIRQNAHWISHSSSSQLARSLFSDKKLVEQMEKNYGRGALVKLYQHLNDVYSDQAIEGVRDPVIRKLSSIVSLRYLSGSLKQIFTQPTSIPAFGFEYGVGKLGWMALKSVMDPQSTLEALVTLWKSPQFSSRHALGQTEFIESAMRQNFGDSWIDKVALPANAAVAAKILASSVKQAYKFGMITNTIGDVIPILTMGPSIYMEEMRRADGNPELALERTWDVIESNQQSHAVKDRSELSRRGGLAAQLVGQFVNTPGQYAAFEARAYKEFRDTIRLDGLVEALKSPSMRKLLNAVAINHVILPGLFTAVGAVFKNFLQDDDWDDEDSIGLGIAGIVGPGSAFMITSALTETFLWAAATGKAKWGGSLIPLESFSKDAKVLGALLNHMREMDFDEAFEDAVEFLPTLSAPSRQIKEALDSRN